MRLSTLTLLGALLGLPFLAGCVDDAAAYMVQHHNHAVIVVREQPYFWEDANIYVVASRLPDCQRRHSLGKAAVKGFKVDLFQTGDKTYVLRLGKRLYLVETQTCQGFKKLDGEPEGGMGELLGEYREKDGRLAFTPALEPAAAPVEGAPRGG